MAKKGTSGRWAGRGLAVGLALLTASCAGQKHAPPVPPPALPPPAAQPAVTPEEETAFEAFLRDFRTQALAAGIDGALYDQALGHVTLDPRIEQLNAAQPEFVRPIWQYLDNAVSAKRIADGQAALTANAEMFARLERQYGVAKEILAAIWANESDYGRAPGDFNIFQALATLAFEGPRISYARPQLLAALKVAQQGPFATGTMFSSWAGAFGQTQFVPTSWLDHAVDFDGDGKKDLWNSPGDALASAAQLLVDYGWQRGQPWGFEVKLPANFRYEQADLDAARPVSDWRALGVTKVSGEALPDDLPAGAIILPAGARGPAFLVFANFNAVLKYNAAVSYGLAVCLLADRLTGGAGIVASWPRDEQPLSRTEREQLQRNLKALGYDPGEIDGVIGRKVRAALRQFQLARNLPADGFATKALLDLMNAELQRNS
ncbi:MAG TPA: lytic murein transglycosylase [Rhizomicrobium sp.]|nr:lytic murein transglycosylase [Rhizomicrobium sp.]